MVVEEVEAEDKLVLAKAAHGRRGEGGEEGRSYSSYYVVVLASANTSIAINTYTSTSTSTSTSAS